MTRKWVALEHPVKGIVDLVLRDFPSHERAVGQIRGEQCLTNTADRPRAQHCRDASHHHIDICA